MGLRGCVPQLTANDLRHPLVAHVQDLGNGLHWEVVFVGGTDRLVALISQHLRLLVKLRLAAGKVLSEGFQAGLGLG